MARCQTKVKQREWEELEAPEEAIFTESPESWCMCQICNNILDDASTIDCGHSFCHRCIVSSLETKLLCPICEEPPEHMTSGRR